jgi:hypothetical protein
MFGVSINTANVTMNNITTLAWYQDTSSQNYSIFCNGAVLIKTANLSTYNLTLNGTFQVSNSVSAGGYGISAQ